MLIVALVLAVIGLAALVTAVVTSNELIAWVCIAASIIGVVLLIVDALRDRSHRGEDDAAADEAEQDPDGAYEDYPEEAPVAGDYEDSPDYRDNPDYGDNPDHADDRNHGSVHSGEPTTTVRDAEDEHLRPAGDDPAKS